jgi:DNA-binding IclR family transcriptional regulator
MLQLHAPDVPTIEVYPGTQAVARALALLKMFSDSQPEWGLRELALATGLNKTTVFRLLAALEAEGLIMRNPLSGGYRLGVELIALGGCAVRSHPVRVVSRPVLEALAQESDETASLEVLVGVQVLIIDEVSSRHPMGMSQDVGGRLPAYATATGKLLLAALPPDESNALLDLPLAKLTDQTLSEPDGLRSEFQTIRQQGYALAVGELEPGFVAVAAPVYDRDRVMVAAISVGGAAARLTSERLSAATTLVQVAARQISRQLGYWPG